MAERVSVVINTLDRASSLRRTLRSLRQLDHRDLEVVVVCGPCRDDTEAVLAEFAGEIKVGRCPDANLSRSRNIGIRLAAGEFVAFIDDDAYPDPAWITRLLTGFRGPEVAAVGGPVFDYTGVLFQTRQLMVDWFGNWMQRSVDLGRWLSFPGSRWVPYAMGTNGIYRRSRLLEVGGFDEEIEYHIDETDLCRRLVDRGYVIAYVDDAYVYHKVLQSRLRTSERAYLSRYPILKNRAYFALRHARGRASMADLCADLTGYVELQRAELEENIATRGLDPGARERFRRDVARAYDDAWVSAHRPRRTRPRSWFEEEHGDFLRFPTLRPAGEKLHVCLLTDEYLPAQLNGIARTIHTLATGLAERGHVVRVVLAGEEPGSVDLMDGVWVHRVPIRPHPHPSGFPHPAVWNYSASLLDELVRIDGWRPIDIVQAPNWGAPAIAALMDGRFRTVLSLHTPLKTVAQMDHRARRWGRTRKEYRRLIDVEARVYPLPDAYLASTPSIVDEIEEQYGIELDRNRTAYVGHGLPDITASVAANSRSEGDEVELLFVGRLEPRKGIDVLLACIPGLAAEFPHLRFTIVGKDDIPGPNGITYRQAFERSPEGARLRDRVRFTGLVSDEELWRHYAACDLFVAPSRYESFGLILVEAMMFGKPIVACDVGGMRRVVEHEGNGLLVPSGDSDALARAIARLAGSMDLRRQYGTRSRELYEQHYSAHRMVEETNRFYDRLLGRSTSAQQTAGLNGLARPEATIEAVASPAISNTFASQASNKQAGITAASADVEVDEQLTGDQAVADATPTVVTVESERRPYLRPLYECMVCPACRSRTRLIPSVVTADGRVKTGQLLCDHCARVAAIIRHFKYDFLIDGKPPLEAATNPRVVPRLGERRVHWSDPHISYGPGWERSPDGYMKSLGRPGDAFTYRGVFTDAQVRLLRHPHGGLVEVSLDGRRVECADLFMEPGVQPVAVTVAEDLPLGEHEITVRALGTANPASHGRQVPFEELVLFGPIDDGLGFVPPLPLNRGNGYPEVVERYLEGVPPTEWVLECGGGDRRRGAPNVVNMEYMKYELADLYADAHSMPFEDGTFALVYSQAVFEHLRHPFDVARELIRVTQPGGLIVTEVAFLQPLHGAPYHYFNMTTWGVEELFKGCTVVESGWQGSLAFTVDWMMKAVQLEGKISRSKFKKIVEEFEKLDRLVSHEEMKPAASGVWVVVRKDE